MNPKDLVTVRQFAEMNGISVQYVYQLIRSKKAFDGQPVKHVEIAGKHFIVKTK